jgi:hypothetical protein
MAAYSARACHVPRKEHSRRGKAYDSPACAVKLSAVAAQRSVAACLVARWYDSRRCRSPHTLVEASPTWLRQPPKKNIRWFKTVCHYCYCDYIYIVN